MLISVVLCVLLVLLFLSVYVAVALAMLGLFIDWVYSPFPLHLALGDVTWTASDSALLMTIPLFVMMGEILVRSGLAQDMYKGLDRWLSWLPGGLLHANIGSSTLFSAVCGSSVATAATITTVAMPQARALGYGERLFAGSIAAGGTLGILIPPSINLIIYGVLTQTSVPKLFMAGLIPGLLLALMFIIITVILCQIWPQLGGPQRHHSWSERFKALRYLVPVLILFTAVVASIYAGWATPTEAASLGVLGAFLIAILHRSLTRRVILEVFEGTARTTAMIMLIIIASYFLNFALASVGFAGVVSGFLDQLGLGAYSTLLVVIVLYFVLGLFVETLSLMVITIPIVAPIIIGLGFDPIWFGILLIVLIEMALITPPVGLNLFVVQGIRGRGTLNDVVIGAIPYVVVMFLMIGLLVLFPDIALMLPRLLS